MPQIGQLRKGLWVASGFGRQGLNTSAMAGQLIARSIVWGDDRWRLFSPFELVWAGGATGRVAGHLIGLWGAAVPPRQARWPVTAKARAPGTHARGATGGSQPAGRRRGRRRRSAGRRARRVRSLRSRRRRRIRSMPAAVPSQESEVLGAVPCNVAARGPYLDGEPLRPPRTETST